MKKIDNIVYKTFYNSYKKLCEKNKEKPIPYSEFKLIFNDIVKNQNP